MKTQPKTQLTKALVLVAIATAFAAAGCELIVDFDRTKMAVEAVDSGTADAAALGDGAVIGDGSVAPVVDAGDAGDAETPDATADAGDAGDGGDGGDAG